MRRDEPGPGHGREGYNFVLTHDGPDGPKHLTWFDGAPVQ